MDKIDPVYKDVTLKTTFTLNVNSPDYGLFLWAAQEALIALCKVGKVPLIRSETSVEERKKSK